MASVIHIFVCKYRSVLKQMEIFFSPSALVVVDVFGRLDDFSKRSSVNIVVVPLTFDVEEPDYGDLLLNITSNLLSVKATRNVNKRDGFMKDCVDDV